MYLFDGDRLIVQPRGKPASEYSVWIDCSQEPKRLSIIAKWKSGKVSASDSAYELMGNELRWCHIGGQYPGELLPDDSPVGTIIKLRR